MHSAGTERVPVMPPTFAMFPAKGTAAGGHDTRSVGGAPHCVAAMTNPFRDLCLCQVVQGVPVHEVPAWGSRYLADIVELPTNCVSAQICHGGAERLKLDFVASALGGRGAGAQDLRFHKKCTCPGT